MTISTLALVNGAVALLIIAALAAVVSLGLRIHRTDNQDSLVPAAPTPLRLHDDVARAA